MKIHFHGGQGTRQWKSRTMRLVAEKMAAKRVVGAEPPARPEVYAHLEDNRVPLSRYFVPSRLVAPRYAPHLPPPSSRATRTWLIFTASCVPRPKKNEVFPVYDLINIETRGQWGRSRRENCCFNVSSSLNKTAN